MSVTTEAAEAAADRVLDEKLYGAWIGSADGGDLFVRIVLEKEGGLVGCLIGSEQAEYKITRWKRDSRDYITFSLAPLSANLTPLSLRGRVIYPELYLTLKALGRNDQWERDLEFLREGLITNKLARLQRTMAIPSKPRPDYPQDISKWLESAVPGKGTLEREFWISAANTSTNEWRVYSDAGVVKAILKEGGDAVIRDAPSFTPKVDRFDRVRAARKVDDGWLIGFNEGEWGGALYWFSLDGTDSYKISDDQVVDFFEQAGSIRAIQGLAHLGLSRGSVVQIARVGDAKRWTASKVVTLPFAPRCVTIKKDGTALIALSDSIVSLGGDGKMEAVSSQLPWNTLYPNSLILSADEKKSYIGMRQFVAEFDLDTHKLRFFYPSPEMLHKLSAEDEAILRKMHNAMK